MTENLNDLSWWRARLSGERPPTDVDTPMRGFYRVRNAPDAPWRPIAYWYDQQGNLCCDIGGKPVNDLKARELWPFASKSPVTYAAYEAVAERGEPWPDLDRAVHAQIGHNNPPDDPAVILSEQIEAAKANIKDYARIEDDATAAKGQSLRARLLELSGQADQHREREKRPHLEASKAVDGKWMPLVKEAKSAADAIRAELGRWETSKADAARRDEEARRKAAQDNAPPPPPPNMPAPQARVRGAYGRAASVRAARVVTAITDLDALFAYLRDRKVVHDWLMKLAQYDVDAGIAVPGVTIEERRNIV